MTLQAVLDLRKADVSCQVHTHNMGQKISRAVSSLASWFWHGVLRQRGKIDRKSKILVPEDILDEAAPCWRCSRTCAARYGTHAKVYHGEQPNAHTAYLPFLR